MAEKVTVDPSSAHDTAITVIMRADSARARDVGMDFNVFVTVHYPRVSERMLAGTVAHPIGIPGPSPK